MVKLEIRWLPPFNTKGSAAEAAEAAVSCGTCMNRSTVRPFELTALMLLLSVVLWSRYDNFLVQ